MQNKVAPIGHLIRFLGMPVMDSDHSFNVSPSQLARRGVTQRHLKMKNSVTQRQYGAPRSEAMKKLWSYRGLAEDGHLAVLLSPSDLFGKCVYVQHADTVINASAVSASIDSSPYFSRDGPVPQSPHESVNSSAWHAVKVHNFCRPMGMPEACCERVGSIMQNNWSKRKGEDAGAIMDSVLIQDGMLRVSLFARGYLVASALYPCVGLGVS